MCCREPLSRGLKLAGRGRDSENRRRDDIVAGHAVLIVDDDRSFVDALSMLLEECGYRPIRAYSGREGRDHLRTAEADLAIIDVHMPDLDGTELLCLARRLTRPVPVIMISSDDGQETARRCRSIGAAGFLAKPVAPDELLNLIPVQIARAV
jgi:DNA-binding response OmpR family regulator